MRNIKKIFVMHMVMLAVFAAFFAAAGHALAARGGEVYDNAGLLTQSEKVRLTSAIQAVEQKHGVRIGVIVQKTLQGRNVGQVANALLDQGYIDGKNGGIVLLLAMDTRDYYISTDNKMRARITDDKGIQHISSEFVPLLSNGDYAGGFLKFVQTVDSMLTYYETEGAPYDPSAGFHPIAAAISAALALLGGGAVRSSMISSMSNVRPASQASEYLVKDSFDLTEEDDSFLFMNVTRHKKSKSGGGSSARDSSHGGGGGKF